MNRHFSKKHLTTRRAPDGSRFRWMPFAIIILLIGAGFFIYQHKKSTLNSLTASSTVNSFYSKATAWITEKRSHLERKTANIKKTPKIQNEIEPQIHFEFYTALPNMQIAGSDLIAKKKPSDESDNATITSEDDL